MSDLATRTLLVDVWADVACPWCWIGEHRLAAAVARLSAERPELVVDRRWRPYQLQPGLPPRGEPWGEFADRKFGGAARMAAAFGHVAAAGAADGLTFRFDRMTVAPNTRAAHRLVLHAGRTGAGDAEGADVDAAGAGRRELAMADRLFRAYFADGADVTDPEVLADLAVEEGMEREATLAFLAGDALALDVQASQREAARLGVQGVPFVVLDGRLAVSGAQPVELFERALRAALEPA